MVYIFTKENEFPNKLFGRKSKALVDIATDTFQQIMGNINSFIL